MSVDPNNLAGEVQDLKTQLAVQQATMTGAQATQAATQAGQASTNAAAHAGTWSTFIGSGAALVVGMALGIAIVAVRSK
jgi:hypothetical protein